MPVTYKDAPTGATKTIAVLIKRYHDHLSSERVDVVFRSEAAKRVGRQVWGDARKIAGLGAFLARREDDQPDPVPGEDADAVRCAPFFVLTVAGDVWRILDDGQREALLDHLLSYCRVEDSENGARLFIAPPEAAEFPAVVARHGLWRDEVEKLVKAASEHQPSLFAEGAFDQRGFGGDADEAEALIVQHKAGVHADELRDGCVLCQEEVDAAADEKAAPVPGSDADKAARKAKKKAAGA
ncbi:MAG: putative metallopeptidase [Pseudomonadota bacterium]